MRSRVALVHLLTQAGLCPTHAQLVQRLIDGAGQQGFRSDDVAGALLRWKGRTARQSYACGLKDAWDVWSTSQTDAVASQVPPTSPLDESLPGPIQSVQQTTSHSYPS
jgi:hypothetical protein